MDFGSWPEYRGRQHPYKARVTLALDPYAQGPAELPQRLGGLVLLQQLRGLGLHLSQRVQLAGDRAALDAKIGQLLSLAQAA